MAFDRLSLVLGGLFFVSAALQYNDPDPWPWIAMYVAAGIASTLAAFAGTPRRIRNARIAAAVVGLAALAWAAVRTRAALPNFTFAHLVDSMKAETPAIEESRELLGLLLIGLWMIVSFFRLRTTEPRGGG